MNRKMLLIVALMLGAWAGAANACMMMEGARTNPSWQAEYEALGNSFPVVWVAAFDGSSPVARGSGVVIDDGHWVLTAAHNLRHGQGEITQPMYDGFYIGTGSNIYNDPGQFAVATEWYAHPDYTEGIYTPDIALLYFPDPIPGVTPAPRFRGTDQVGALLTMAGYGRPAFPSTGWLEPDGKRRGFEAYLTELGGSWMGAPSYQALAEFYRFSDLRLNGLGTPGHSGGGMFNQDGELMGIIGFGTGINYGARTGGTRVSLYNDWIDATTPEPATLILLGIGAVLLGRRRA